MRRAEFYLFPYEKVPKGSRVIIYAMGNVGRSFWSQLKQIEYCQVIACVDKYYNATFKTKYNIVHPREINRYSYDYIVVAVNSEKLAAEIVEELVKEYDVKKEKIIYEESRRIAVQTVNYSLEQIIEDPSYLEYSFLTFWTSEGANLDYFNEWIRDAWAFDNTKRKRFREILINCITGDIRNNILIYRLIYACGLMRSSEYKQYIQNIALIENDEARLWNLFDATIMERDCSNLRYADYYHDKRMIMQQSLDKCTVLSHSSYKSKKHVAILTTELRGELSSHNGLIVPYANEMSKQGYEVGIFPFDLFRYRVGETFILPIFPLEERSDSFKEYHERVFTDGVRVFYSDGNSMLERATSLMKQLEDFSPFVVFDFSGEYSFISAKVHQYYKIIAIPMRGYCTSSTCDIYMCRNKDICVEENRIYNSVSNEQMREALICSSPTPVKRVHTKSEYGIKDNSFVITTVGVRLATELTEEFVDIVCSFLENNEDSYWVLVGSSMRLQLKEKHNQLFEKNRIISLGFEDDLIGFYYGVCDIYWNPNRMGSGGSIGSAMRCGLPVVMTRYPSDALPRLGIENAIDGGYEDCLAYVQLLHDDIELYNEKSELMQTRMTLSGVPEYVTKLLDTALEITQNE